MGSILYYGRDVYPTILKALWTIADKQSYLNEATPNVTKQLLGYCATRPDEKIRYHASDMIFQLHSDTSYLNYHKSRITAGVYFFLGSMPQLFIPILLNGKVHFLCTIIKHAAASAAEAELGTMFINS